MKCAAKSLFLDGILAIISPQISLRQVYHMFNYLFDSDTQLLCSGDGHAYPT
jgi:hypothetical protein